MPQYCPDCGVEIVTQRESCPLCNALLQSEQPSISEHFPSAINTVASDPVSFGEIRKILFAALSIMIGVGIISVMVVNLSTHGALTWARYAVSVLIASWALTGLALYNFHRPLRLLWQAFFVTSTLLILLNLFAGGLTWSVRYALPILLWGALINTALYKTLFEKRPHWANAIASVLIAVAAFCVGLQLILAGLALPTWSAIVALSLAPPVAFLMYVRYRLSKTMDLKKIFHR